MSSNGPASFQSELQRMPLPELLRVLDVVHRRVEELTGALDLRPVASGSAVEWQSHVVCDPRILCWKPTLRGTRMSVEFVLELLAGGWDRDALAANYSNLTDERIRAVLAYAAETFREDRFHLLPPVETGP